jgi:hypothetical protein
MRKTVHENGMETRITQDDLEHTLGSRIFPEDRVDLFAKSSEHQDTIMAHI